jgi:hypothetical protein
MATEVRIPKLGVAVEEGQITDWLCEDGDVVEAGQPIYELATDKTRTTRSARWSPPSNNCIPAAWSRKALHDNPTQTR